MDYSQKSIKEVLELLKTSINGLSEKEAKRKFYEEEPLYLGEDPLLAEELVIIDCTRD